MNTVSRYLAASTLGILLNCPVIAAAQTEGQLPGSDGPASHSAEASASETPSPQNPVEPTAAAQKTLFEMPLQALRTSSVKTATGKAFGDVQDVVVRNDGGHAGLLIISADGKSVLFAPAEALSWHSGELIIQDGSLAEEIGEDSNYDISRYQSASQGARTLQDAIDESRVSTR